MKRLCGIALLVLALVPVTAGARSIGIGVFGGASIPIVQDDNGSGSIFGVRVPVKLLPLVTIEPYFGATKGGDGEQEIGGSTYTITGFDVNGFGANLLLTFGGRVQFYPFVGIASNSLSREGSEDLTMTGFNFGLGLGFSPAPKIGVHLRGDVESLSDGAAGRTFASVTAGVSYDLFSFPAP